MRYMEEIAMQCNHLCIGHAHRWMDGYKHTQCVAGKY